MARTKGAKGKYPAHGKLRDELLKHNFDWIKEFCELFYNPELHLNEKFEMLKDVARYLFPVRKPEDSTGDASQPAAFIPVTDEQLEGLVKIARGEKA